MVDLPDTEHEIPLTEATFLILLSLADGPSHGYAIMQDILTLSNGRIDMSTGTLYGALKRLLEQQWIVRSDDDAEAGSGRSRKAYTLTERGYEALRAEAKRLETLAHTANLRLQRRET